MNNKIHDMNNQFLHHNNSLRFLLRFAALIAVMMAWMVPAKAQEGVWYIANDWAKSDPAYTYNQNNTANNFYLVPAKDPQQTDYRDAYFSENYDENDGDPERPYLTTYQTNKADNDTSIWVIQPAGDNKYFLIHAITGKYVVYQLAPDCSSKPHRKTMHLETLANPANTANAKFYIENGSTTYTFRPQSLGSGNRFFNPAGGDKPYYHATGGDCNNTGLVGVYSDASDGGSKWHLESALFDAPDITLDISTNKFTIADVNSLPSGYTIRYTTGDGSQDAPTATTGEIYSAPVPVSSTTTVKAAVVRYGIVLTDVAIKEVSPFILNPPTFGNTCDNKLEIICSNLPDGGQIRYTVSTDGNAPADPTSSSTLYEAPVALASGDKVKAKAFYGSFESEVSAVHTHSFTHTEAPTITTTSATEVTITGPSGSTIYYTTNGVVDPVIGASGVTSHSSPVTVDFGGNMTEFRAIAKTTSLEVSCVVKFVTMGRPDVTIEADACTEAAPRGNVIVIPLPSDGSTVWYAVTAGDNSAAPDIDALPNPYTQYTGDVVLDDLDGSIAYYTIHAYALSSDGQFKSSVVSVSHEMKTAGKPELTPPSGSSPVVGISGGVFGDVAVCSATGVVTQNIPIASDGTAEYTITPEASGTLTVVFKHDDWLYSCEATYEIPEAPATPEASQSCDNKLSLSTESPMAIIHYTIDGTAPLITSATYTTGCLYNIEPGTRVRAKAFEGFLSSPELNFVYQPEHVAVPQFFVNGTTVTISGPAGSNVYYTQSVGTQAGVRPSDPDDPDASSDPVEGPINIAEGNIITVFKAIAIPEGHPEQASCVVPVETREGYSINVASDLNKLNEHPGSYFFVLNDIDAGNYPTNTVSEFTGVLDGNYYTISKLKKPLFNTITGADAENNAAVLNLMLKEVDISTSGNAGAIANTATGYTRIYNCGILPDAADGTTTSSISGGDNVGGLVGELSGTARVINCFSYADITGGDYRGGIVGNNNVATASQNDMDGDHPKVNTMIMNCMFYGDIASEGTVRAPIYGGTKISNSGAISIKGLNNYNYFRFNKDYVANNLITDYNCALGAQDRFLVRFEFFRNILNSNRELAMWYVSGSVDDAANEMGHWVLDKSVAPYPILKEPGQAYPSIINPDAAHAIPIDPENEHRNKGRKLGELTVKIKQASDWDNAPDGAALKDASYATTGLTINITDKDEANYNFNYYKIQLPYYNEVGTNNYKGNKVVTGWKITGFTGGTAGSFTTGTDVVFDGQGNIESTPYNFVDRACTNKDLYGTNGSYRVFNQGAYYEVPDGVTAITIEPYWANCVYLSDANYDVTYDGPTAKQVTIMGNRPTTSFNGDDDQVVYTSLSTAHSNLGSVAGATVYDYAIVLVGNYHEFFGGTTSGTTVFLTNGSEPFTIMSADLDGDNEPDNTFFYQHTGRKKIAPVRFDFLNVADLGLAQKEDGATSNFQVGIFYPKGWFEITNTVLIHFGQFEYADGTNKSIDAPLILQGGIYEQFVSARNAHAKNTTYLLIGGNVWFKNFANGCHTGGSYDTPKVPVNISGGDYSNFYLSGIYRPQWEGNDDSAECYIDGGRFGEVAGAGMQVIKGDVTWLINAADIKSFFGGGINNAAGKSIEGNITTVISNSYVNEFCGGPKFGNMKPNKTVKTTATNCHFGNYFGAGFGGTAFNRVGVEDATIDELDFTGWNGSKGWRNKYYKRQYQNTQSASSTMGGTITVNAISTSYEYEYLFFSGGATLKKVARFYINFATLSLASTNDVTSTLTGCTIGNFYGGGKFGYVNGDAFSTLTDCTVTGDAFGSGFSAAKPTCEVMPNEDFRLMPSYNNSAGVFNDEQVEDHGYPETVTYTWKEVDAVGTGYSEEGGHFILTTEDLDNLGAVSNNATLTINGNTVVKGDVYGGGAKSSSNTTSGTCTVNINGGTYGEAEASTGGNIYGGGMGDADNAVTEGVVEVNIGNSTQSANSVVINGSVFGCNNANGSPQDNVTVNIYKTKHNSSNVVTGSGFAISQVFGGGNQAHYTPTAANKKATVHVHDCDNTIQYVYGGGNAANVGTSGEGIKSATDVIIDGGRIEWVFGGGNGAGDENPGANIYGNTGVTYHSGNIAYLFGGSNEKGSISGTKTVSVLGDGDCDPKEIGELYGGNNKADTEGNISFTMACTDNPCKIDYLFGGSRQANVTGNIELNVYGGEYDYVFGGNNISGTIGGHVTLNLYGGTIHKAAFGGNKGGGSISGNITVNVMDAENTDCPLVVKDVFGAGDQATYTAPTGEGAREFNPMVNINHIRSGQSITGNVYGGGNGDPDNSSQEPGMVTGKPKVIIGDMTEGHEDYIANISGNVYGGGNAAKVDGNTAVLVQQDNSVVNYNIFGGGNLANVTGSTTVNVEGGTVYSVYGGGALAGTGPTTVNILAGTIEGNVYGGCLGGEYNNTIYYPAVDGTTTVNIGSGTVDPDTGLSTSTSGSATFIGGSVFGGNDAYGSPTGNATVNIYQTAHTSTNLYTYLEDDGTYAIAGVFGGGNQADFEGSNAYVNVYGCDNTIERVFGGSNAASAETVNTMIQGGRIGQVFGGGNGYISSSDEADIHGDVNLDIHGGIIREVYGGGNEVGTITGVISLNVDKTSDCDMIIREVYSGGNQAANAAGNITIGCTGTLTADHSAHPENIGVTLEGIGTVYGGANQANIGAAGEGNESNIVLNINSGIVANVFGGNNNDGTIYGTITVNIEKNNNASCASNWYVGNVFGGGNLAEYSGTPEVNILNGTVSGNVYGGGNGDPDDSSQEPGQTGAPTVTIGDLTSAHSAYQAIVLGDVYGGGNAAKVTGTTAPTVQVLNKSNTEIGNVYGGGNAANVPATNVTIAGGTIHNDVFGGGHGSNTSGSEKAANVTGNASVSITGAVIDRAFAGSNLNGSIEGTMTLSIDKSASANSDMKIREVYGGSNEANGKAGTITIGCTGTLVALGEGEHYGVDQEGIGTVYGGANAANISNAITLNITKGIIENVFGGNNQSGSITGGVTVNIDKNNDATCAANWYVGDVYGGGNHAAYTGTPNVNIKNGTVSGSVFGGGNDITTANAGVGGSNVEMTGGTVLNGLYGGCNLNGYVTGNSVVKILGGEIGSQAKLTDSIVTNVFGGGLGANTFVNDHVTVTIGAVNEPTTPTIYGDVYGGSALGSVNSDADDKTTVHILGGLLKTRLYEETLSNGQTISYYTGGNVYGGGLGQKAVGESSDPDYVPPIAAVVKGVVTVNIGTGTVATSGQYEGYTTTDNSGCATIGGNVYGCNNANGSPEQNVSVNVFHTGHPTGTGIDDSGYAIANVFGGGNEADFTAAGKTAAVNIYGCDNTIRRTFGGGNAAAAPHVATFIQGGRFFQVFGGGNGERGSDFGADITNGIDLNIHGGNVGQFFGGSNQNGSLSGALNTSVDNNGPCESNLEIDEFFCGGNFVNINGNLETTIDCSNGMSVNNLYGGCNQANITGNVVLNLYGGTYTSVYGGSKGDLASLGTGHVDKQANIGGNVTLNLYGGTIENVYGGSNINGNIGGVIAVNVLDAEGECPLYITNIYGGSNLTDYVPDSLNHMEPITDPNRISPVVNVVHAKYGISGNVYGGSRGDAAALTPTKVMANPRVNIGYDGSSMDTYLPNTTVYPRPSLPRAIISGNVFGGGDAAKVMGNTAIFLRNKAKVFGNVYGGGNMGEVTGNTKVIVNGANE